MEASADNSRMRGRQATRQRYVLPIILLLLTQPAMAVETDMRGYLGYVSVVNDQEVDCETRSCQGVFEDTLFYGLSLNLQGEELGAQVIVSQDEAQNPEVSLAQITARTGLGGIEASFRLGKIIVPLGLYGSQRITPNARPGLVLPQSFFLNTYYDLLTLSDRGLGVHLTSDRWALKAAAFSPVEEIFTQIVQDPTVPLEEAGFLERLARGLFSDLFGDLADPPPGGEESVVTEEREFEGGYLGASHVGDTTRTDIGMVRLDLNGNRLDAFNFGNAWMIGRWEPSIELFRLDFKESGDKADGISVNLVYSEASWQAFSNWVVIEDSSDKSREWVVGGAYYWDDHWSGLIAAHRLDGSFSGLPRADDQEINSLSLSIAYSWH